MRLVRYTGLFTSGGAVQFRVLRSSFGIPGSLETCFLIEESWNDWWEYETLYAVHFRDASGQLHEIGSTKIGQADLKFGEDRRRPQVPISFEALNRKFFSLGQDVSYYSNLMELPYDDRRQLLAGICDVVADNDLFEEHLHSRVMRRSLLRSVPRKTVETQFRRVLDGGAVRSEFHFSYNAPATARAGGHKPISLSFAVDPTSNPPSNVHVLVGRNGVGKTHLLNNMSLSLADSSQDPKTVGAFDSSDDGKYEPFVNVVSVSFSAFDTFEPIKSQVNETTGTRYTYVGLKRPSLKGVSTTKSSTSLARDFGRSVNVCLQGQRLNRWRRALEMLETDPIFSDLNVAELSGAIDTQLDEGVVKSEATELYRGLSSGHKVVLLTITQLVEYVEERSLVLIDEPEAHLHPPLLAAFVRALSDLLINRNGVAIIATHSPVVLQEVPRSCVWKLQRFGRNFSAERPYIETFGENVGVLTHEVFGLEAEMSGFHRILLDAARSGRSFDSIVDDFDGQLGGEAKGILRGMISARESGDPL